MQSAIDWSQKTGISSKRLLGAGPETSHKVSGHSFPVWKTRVASLSLVGDNRDICDSNLKRMGH